eukprot:TRINITY_DN18149_c0_g1_i4.p1 TRINITY_DN18149_c0_g1~~TRINITY_DN18149_c0_g1_i4.p1  ORF type:complete len:316 (-),score=18.12 TRINITY_DN18149_c0_g1_i4:704-1651(-)
MRRSLIPKSSFGANFLNAARPQPPSPSASASRTTPSPQAAAKQIEAAALLLPCSLCGLFAGYKLGGRGRRRRAVVFCRTALDDAKLDALLDRAELDSESRPAVMAPFRLGREWLWTRWEGTLTSVTWQCMLLAAVAAFGLLTWEQQNPDVKEALKSAANFWKFQLSTTTFFLAFYLNQTYTYWRNMYNYCRQVQGRLNDVNMVLASHLPRDPSTGKPTEEAELLALQVARYGRVLAILSTALINRRFSPLATHAGLRRMLARGALTQSEVTYLMTMEPIRWCYALMAWNLTLVQDGAPKNRWQRERSSWLPVRRS